MPYTFDDFYHDLALEILEKLSPEERLKGLPPEEILKELSTEEMRCRMMNLPDTDTDTDTDILDDQNADFAAWVNKLKHKRYDSWQAVIDDPELDGFPGNIEWSENGALILSPSPSAKHIDLQDTFVKLLTEYAAIAGLKGKTSQEAPSGDNKLKGTRKPDANWASSERRQYFLENDVFILAPEICIEVQSPNDDKSDFETKKRFYFQRNALEVWLSDQRGHVKFYERQNPDKLLFRSLLFPDFPAKIPEQDDELERLFHWLRLLNELKNNNFGQFGYKVTKI